MSYTKKRLLVITDNVELLKRFIALVVKKRIVDDIELQFAYSFNNKLFESFELEDFDIRPIRVRDSISYIVENFDLVFSLHCKQFFPVELVKMIKCINIHPGLNPFNRGWFPQVFSIINKLPLGATIHEIDEFLDHGPIIAQKEVKVELWDTSLSAYNKVIDAEMSILEDVLDSIISGSYKVIKPSAEGNLNLKKDFDELCEINLEEKLSFLECINRLRALTHGNYKNAYFIDPETKKKVFVEIKLSTNE